MFSFLDNWKREAEETDKRRQGLYAGRCTVKVTLSDSFCNNAGSLLSDIEMKFPRTGSMSEAFKQIM